MESFHWTTYILPHLLLFAIAQIATITIFCNHFYFKPDDDHWHDHSAAADTVDDGHHNADHHPILCNPAGL